MVGMKARILALIFSLLFSVSYAAAAETVGEAADILARAIDGKGIRELLDSKNPREVLTGLRYLETVKLFRYSHFNKLRAEKLICGIALFNDIRTVGEAANILARAIDGKSLDELLNSNIKEVVTGFNYLNRVNTLSEETITADQGELIRITAFNGEITKESNLIWHNIDTGSAVPVTKENYKDITFTVNEKSYILEKQGDHYIKVEKPLLPDSETTKHEVNILLPRFSLLLKGKNEVRITNPNDFKVTVALRLGDRGKDFDVAANGIASVFVPNGTFKIYFVYSNKPDALFQGDDFSLNNNGIEIQIVKVVGGNYGIRQVK